ncbi:MAG: dockerin type I repeat-containing protein [Muribaculaceae bacterium]|nr:dockerin type I repeat-containing protein [Muribaculaceae bacterium]
MKKIFTLMAVAAIALAAQAAQLTVADGTDTNQYIPFRAAYFNYPPYFGQVIYPAGQLTQLEGKNITGLTFYIANEGGSVMNGGELSFFLGVVDVSEYSIVSPFRIPESNLTLVGTLPMTQGESQIALNFDTPFAYAGGNLALMVKVTQAGTVSGTGYFYGMKTSVPSAVYGGNQYFTEQFYPKTTFTYDDASAPAAVTLISEANALEDNTPFMFNGNAVVTVCWKGSVYVRDESGYGQIANYDGTFENGQVLSQGWNATKTSANGWVEFIDAAGLSASGETNVELAAPQKLTDAVDESMLNAYVYVEKVYKSFFPIRSITLADGTIIQLTGTGNQPATGNYNIYGIIWKSGDALVFEPVAWETYVEPPTFLRGDVNKDTEVNIADVTALIDKLLNNAEMIPEADCNQDTQMNIADVTALIDYLLNGAWPN